MKFTAQHLLEAREHASRRTHPPTPAPVIQLPPPTEDVDMDITEVIPPKRLAVLQARCRRP
jgi:hypothetical protein